jgi:hypothetical protein
MQKEVFNDGFYLSFLRPSKKRILSIGLVNLLLLGAMLYGVIYTVILGLFDGYHVLLPWVLLFFTYFIFTYIIFLKLGWGSFGHFILGIILVERVGGRRLSALDMIEYWFKTLLYRLKYVSIYNAFYFFTSSFHQSKEMEELGILYVKYHVYKKAIKNGSLEIY